MKGTFPITEENMQCLPMTYGQLNSHLEKDHLQTHLGLFLLLGYIGFSIFQGSGGAVMQNKIH